MAERIEVVVIAQCSDCHRELKGTAIAELDTTGVQARITIEQPVKLSGLVSDKKLRCPPCDEASE